MASQIKKPDKGSDKNSELLPDLVGDLIANALKMNATDIHLDPVDSDSYRICLRIDGVIRPDSTMERSKGEHLINQIKVAANFTPDRTFSPLEGRLQISLDQKNRDIRVTIVPTTRDEAVHLRLLSPPQEVMKPEQLGLPDDALKQIRQTLSRPEGLILITGATGSGKTMSLYSLASFLDLSSLIGVCVEDPVEFDVDYLRQIQADPEHGLTMAKALKTVLRMDPDVILIGEIRDAQSANAAVRAAASGRFVLATLHASSASLAIETCLYHSVPRHLLASTLRLIMSQALVRRLCKECSDSEPVTEEDKKLFEKHDVSAPDQVAVPKGCEECFDLGYKGRVGIFEVLPVKSQLAQLIAAAGSTDDIREQISRDLLCSLKQDAVRKAAEGLTSLKEIRTLHDPTQQ